MNLRKSAPLALWSTLALAGSMIATTSAIADTSKTSAAEAAPSLLDKLVLSYWAAYYGPSIASPTAFTNDSGARGAVGPEGNQGKGDGSELQQLDSTLTLGYKVTDQLVLAGNYRFIIRPGLFGGPIEGGNTYLPYKNKDPWVNLIAPKLYHNNGLNISADIRLYIPAMTNSVEFGALRLTQTTTYDVPKSRLTLGLYTYERANFLNDAGANGGMENLNFLVSPFASYQMTSTLAATLWSDVIQATYANVAVKDGAPQGWDNPAMDLSLGIGWDVTPKINFNPQVTVYPGFMTLNNTTIGAVFSAKIL